MLTTTPDGLLDDGGGVLRPHKRSGMTIPLVDVGRDGADGRSHRVKRGAANGLAREDAEPRLDHVQPGRALRREMKLDRRMLGKPRLYCGGRVCGRVVEDDVQRAPAIPARKLLHEAQEVRARVLWGAGTDHAPARNVQSGVQTRQPVAPIVMRLS